MFFFLYWFLKFNDSATSEWFNLMKFFFFYFKDRAWIFFFMKILWQLNKKKHQIRVLQWVPGCGYGFGQTMKFSRNFLLKTILDMSVKYWYSRVRAGYGFNYCYQCRALHQITCIFSLLFGHTMYLFFLFYNKSLIALLCQLQHFLLLIFLRVILVELCILIMSQGDLFSKSYY